MKNVLLVSVVFLPLADVSARESPSSLSQTPMWYNLGAGLSSVGAAFGGGFSSQIGQHLVSIRSIYLIEVGPFSDQPEHTSWDVGAMYGRFSRTGSGFTSIAAGIGVTGGVRRGQLYTRVLRNVFSASSDPMCTRGWTTQLGGYRLQPKPSSKAPK